MSIRVVCPKGHQLVVRDEMAGQTGRCPVCRSKVTVPRPSNGSVSEDDILGFLGPCNPGPKPYREESEASSVDEAAEAKAGAHHRIDGPSPPMKACDKCNREIEAKTHICPYCHTYIAGLSDF